MDLTGYVINAVLVEGRKVNEVCAAHGISRSWLYELIARYRQQGEPGLAAGSKRPRSSPTKVPAAIEDEIVALRKSLAEEGWACPPPRSVGSSRAASAGGQTRGHAQVPGEQVHRCRVVIVV